MDEQLNKKSTINADKTSANNSLGLLALEYDDSNSDSEKMESKETETNENNDKDADNEKTCDKTILEKETQKGVNPLLSENKNANQHTSETNTVNLLEYVAKMHNAEVPSEKCIMKQSNTLNSIGNFDKNMDIAEVIENQSDDSINLLEYIANLQKMELPQSKSVINDLDVLDNDGKQTETCSLNENNKESKNTETLMEYRTQPTVVELSDSEDSESDSSSSLDSDSSDSDSSSSNAKRDSDSDDNDDDNDNDNDTNQNADKSSENSCSKKKKSNQRKDNGEKGEFDNLPPIEDLKISVPEVLCDPMGEVAWFVEQMVVVKPKPEKPTLNLDTVLFLEKGSRVLGRVFDVFGPVAEPHYCVRFNNEEHIKENNIKIGMTVYYCPNSPYTTLVFLSELTKMKATDANDYSEHPEFSDDEEESRYYANLRKNKGAQRNNPKKNTQNENSNKRIKTNERQTSWHRRNNTNISNQPRNNYPQQVFMQQPPQFMNQQIPPMMPPYQMPNFYSPYQFGYQNWPPRMPFHGSYGPPVGPPNMPPNMPRFPPEHLNPGMRPDGRFPISNDVRQPAFNPSIQYRPPHNSSGQ